MRRYVHTQQCHPSSAAARKICCFAMISARRFGEVGRCKSVLLLIALLSIVLPSASHAARSASYSGLWWPNGSKVPVILMPETATNPPRPVAPASPTRTPQSPTRTPPPTQTPQPPTETPQPTPTVTPEGGGSIALGAYIHDNGEYVDSGNTLLDWYASLVGRMPALVNIGSDWVHYPNLNVSMLDSIRSHGAMPMWTWMPGDFSKGAYQPAYRLALIAGGAYDPYIRQFATDARNWGHPFYLRFAHEMNGNWYPWGTQAGNPDGNSPADYVAMWQHVHNIFTSVGATNVRWVWCANVEEADTGPAVANYPGDDYVDWIALDGFNWGQTSGHTWQPFSQVFGASYTEVTGITSKPLMLAEIASAEQGGSKADWITQGFLGAIPSQFPRIRAVVWFDALAEQDWRVNSSESALAAFRAVAASPLYQGRLS